MDGLLVNETLVSLANTPYKIINNTNSPLQSNLTMRTLLSSANGDGSLTISTNVLLTLFTNETQTLCDINATNLALVAEINQSQPDNQRCASVARRQARTI